MVNMIASQPRMIKTTINGEFEIILPEHRALRPEWDIKNGGWEKARLDSMRKHLTDQDTMFYVGAEEGDFAGVIASWGVKIALFEPNDRVWPNIKAIWEANNLPNPLFCFNGFASESRVNQDAGLSIGFPPSADGEIIGDHGFKELSDPGEIPQMRIDDAGVIPTAISLDVEGSEWQVLKGAVKTLNTYHPKLWVSIHPEFLANYYKQHSGDLRGCIKNLGYKETLLDYRHECHFFYEAI